jgi:endonuclease-8
MTEELSVHHAASALRTALVGKATLRFDAPVLVGPSPTAGRVIEKVESHGRHLEIEWDDGMVLHTHLRRSGVWHLYRQGERWRRPHQEMCASIENQGWVAVCFSAPLVETFRRPDKRRHPGMGRLGPDLAQPSVDLGRVVNLLLSYPDAELRIGEALLDQRVMCGLGNVCRSEVLWATGISPFGRIGQLTEADAIRVVSAAASQVRTDLRHARGTQAGGRNRAPAVYGRSGQNCVRCPGSIRHTVIGVQRRALYWCPDCQTHFEPRTVRRDDTPVMDSHPAVEAFLADLPWNRVS